MKIPDGYAFGQAVAQTPQGPRIAGQLDGGIGAAVGGLGRSIQGVADVLGAEGVREAAAQDVESRRAAAAAKHAADALQKAKDGVTLATKVNELHDVKDELARGLADGSIKPEQAAEDFHKRTTKVRGEGIDVPDEASRTAIEAHLIGTTGTLGRELTGAIVKRQQSDVAATIDQFGEQVSRDVLRIGPAAASAKFDQMVEATAGAAGLDPARQAKLKQAQREKFHASYFGAAASGAFQAGDITALDAIRGRITGAEGEALDPKQRTELENKAFGYRNAIQAQQDRSDAKIGREVAARDKVATDAVAKFTTLTESGAYASKDAIDQLTQATAGTQFAGYARELLGQQGDVAGFASRPLHEQDAIVNEARRRGADPAVGTTPEGAKSVARLERIRDATRAAYNDNPWQAAQQRGVIKDAGTLDVSNLPAALQTLQTRMAQIATVEDRADRKISPLQPLEADALARVLRALPPGQSGAALAQLGAAIGDPQRIAALAKQIGDKDEVMALSMLYAGAGTSQGRTIAELLKRGEQAIKDKTFTPDSAAETGWKAEIAKAINGTFSNGDAEEKYKRAAYLILAARSADSTQGGVSVENAVKLATGGIIERNGQKIPLPYGMQTAEDFDKQLRAVTAGSIAAQAPGEEVFAGSTPIPLEAFVAQLPRSTLVHAGQGLYNVRAGGTYVTNARGQRITIQVKP